MTRRNRTHNPTTFPEKLAAALAETASFSRCDSVGGYPDDWTLLDDLIVVASLSHKEEPTLTISTIPDYIVEHECWMEDDEALQELFDQCWQEPDFRRDIRAARRRERRDAERRRVEEEKWRASLREKFPPAVAP